MSTQVTTNHSEFSEVLGMIRTGRAKAYEAVNVALIETYRAVGAHLSRKVAEASWGKGVVKELSAWLLAQAPELKSFSASNLWRMKQFYEVYRDEAKLVPLVRVLPWTHNLLILGQNKHPEEREFYLRLAVRAKWSKRELERQIGSGAFERTMLTDRKLATPLRVLPEDATGKGFGFTAHYNGMTARGDADQSAPSPQSSYSKQGESGRPDFVTKNSLVITGDLSLPFGLQFACQFDYNTGSPYNIVTGTDANGEGNFNDRPSYASSPGPTNYQTRYGLLTTAATNGNVSRNLGTMPSLSHLNASLRRDFPLDRKKVHDSRVLTLSVRSANLANHTDVVAVGGRFLDRQPSITV